MTDKQITTLMLFAQNYPLVTIAKKQKVSLTTIRQRIKVLSKNHSREFNNALGIRESHKRTRDALRNPASLESFLIARSYKDKLEHLTGDSRNVDNIQEIF